MKDFTLIRFEPAHLFLIDLLPDQRAWLDASLTDGHLKALAQLNTAYTAIYDGQVLGSAGLIPYGYHMARAWAMFGQHIPRPAWVPIVAAIREGLKRGPRRVEATVKDGFGNGCRLVQLLGFEFEGKMKAWGPDGADYFICAKVRPA